MEEKIQQSVKKQVEDKVKDLNEHIKGLEFENETFKETISSIKNDCKQSIENIKTQINENAQECDDAIKRSNHNEQYSRKNNVKIMDIQEDKQESIENLTSKVMGLLQDKRVKLQSDHIIAIHRIQVRKDKPDLCI
ncbi:hypothetical protein DPMN_167342 [Dreissena polymorpha]|uniref:Uncharacterized protein n=1 Tax=Dreissena polymorpha TaxID=45954 RepID=A0A9D4IW99_DREPO|nr:hypothetical protein DPMN_167342 [Dreissena polymorpha]